MTKSKQELELLSVVVFKHKFDLKEKPSLRKYSNEQLQEAADNTLKMLLDEWLTNANANGTWGRMEFVMAEKGESNG